MAQNLSGNAYVLGVGLTQFLKPRRTREYPELGYEAGVKAMLDAKIDYDSVEAGIACYCYGDTTSGELIVKLVLSMRAFSLTIMRYRTKDLLPIWHDWN